MQRSGASSRTRAKRSFFLDISFQLRKKLVGLLGHYSESFFCFFCGSKNFTGIGCIDGARRDRCSSAHTAGGIFFSCAPVALYPAASVLQQLPPFAQVQYVSVKRNLLWTKKASHLCCRVSISPMLSCQQRQPHTACETAAQAACTGAARWG